MRNNPNEIQQVQANQQTSAVSFVSSYLWALGITNSTIAFNSLHKEVIRHLSTKISKEVFETILTLVNERSWSRFNCILTVIVVCGNRLPGGKLFYQAKKLGAITVYPHDFYEQQRATDKLQAHVFAKAKLISNQTNSAL